MFVPFTWLCCDDWSQLGNAISGDGICRIISCILHNDKLVDVCFDMHPSSCVRLDAWHREGLAAPPDHMLLQEWGHILLFLRRDKVISCHPNHVFSHSARFALDEAIYELERLSHLCSFSMSRLLCSTLHLALFFAASAFTRSIYSA